MSTYSSDMHADLISSLRASFLLPSRTVSSSPTRAQTSVIVATTYQLSCVSNITLITKFSVRLLGFGQYIQWTQNLYYFRQNILISSRRWFTLPVSLMIKTRSRGYKHARWRGEASKSLIKVEVELKVIG
jgi:hypothetical protein